MDQKIRESLTRREYEVQFFGFSHTMLNNVVRSEVRTVIKNAVTSLMQHLNKKYGEEIPEDESNSVADRLNDLYINASKTPLLNLESIIGDCISIPHHVLLPEDEKYQRNQHADVEMNKLDREIEELKRRAVKAKYMESKLKEELTTIDAILEPSTRKVNELQKRALVMKQKDKRNMELVEKLEATMSSDLDTSNRSATY